MAKKKTKEKRKEYHKNRKKKLKKFKTDDPEKYKKMKNVDHRVKRRYERKKNVGNNPVRILKRYRRIVKSLANEEIPGVRAMKLVKSIFEEDDLDSFFETYRGSRTKDDFDAACANVIDLLEELLYLSGKGSFYSIPAYSHSVELTFKGKKTKIIFPMELTKINVWKWAHFNFNLFLVHDGDLHYSKMDRIVPDNNFKGDIKCLWSWVDGSNAMDTVKLSKFLDRYGLKVADIQSE